jgi:K+-sensing histidine kinase KdpD
VLAIYWELTDHHALLKRPRIDELSEEEQQKELQFHACYNAENNVQWRSIYIMAAVVIVLTAYIIYQISGIFDINMLVLIFFAIVICFAVGAMFRTFHLFHPMCAKVRDDKVVV